MATLKDVASESGLAVSTVSRILNNRGYISDTAREKVDHAMAKLHYQPNEVARSLCKKKSNTIGVIVPHIRHPYFAELISHLEAAAAKRKYKIILLNAREKAEKFSEYMDLCTSNRVNGIILCNGMVPTEKFLGTHIPVVTIERFLDEGTASVECDNYEGGHLAAQELIGCGCKNLLHISGVSDMKMPANDRCRGFVEVCEQNGVSHREISTSALQYHSEEYHAFLKRLFQMYPETDGVFASSDLIAAQILQVCAWRGIAVPQQLKIVGFDDVSIARLTTPMLTTVHQPLKEMAETAVSLLLSAADGKLVVRKTVLPVSLIRRGTT
ncbi:MAG TPA: LacI family transcriptional regulator [Ruminococcaceae bacterium]|jgi:LacI family sucrose operon transcriptional repressor|nr:LacI family transcriptional regulator [Oscillospiraceae bacterium]HCC01872.1 LacI family transcriptional regulator [Oscillospiraceae bacterium]